jgi:hypothetical protein
MLKHFSSIWFLCKHVDNICVICDNHAPMILNIHVLCVATNMLNNFSFHMFCVQPYCYIGWLVTCVTTLNRCCIQQVEKLLFLLVWLHTHLW